MSYTYINGGFKKIEGPLVQRRCDIKNENLTYVKFPETLNIYLKMVGASRHFIAIVNEFGDDIKFTQYECIGKDKYEAIMKYAQLNNTDIDDFDKDYQDFITYYKITGIFIPDHNTRAAENMFIVCDDENQSIEILFLNISGYSNHIINIPGVCNINLYPEELKYGWRTMIGSYWDHRNMDLRRSLYRINNKKIHDHIMNM